MAKVEQMLLHEKVKAKLFLCVQRRHTRRLEIQQRLVTLTSALDGVNYQPHAPAALSPGKQPAVPNE